MAWCLMCGYYNDNDGDMCKACEAKLFANILKACQERGISPDTTINQIPSQTIPIPPIVVK